MTDREPEQLGEIDQAATAANTEVDKVERQIRSFIRLRKSRRSETSDVDVNAVNSPIDPSLRGRLDAISGSTRFDSTAIPGVAAASISEIERVIAELSSVRDMLRSEADRVQREIAGYASLSQVATTSVKIIADSLAQWKSQTPRVEG